LPKSQVSFEIEVQAEEFGKIWEQEFKKIAARVKIPGFRPGKAPKDKVLKEVQEGAVTAEAIDKAVPQAYFEAVSTAKIVPIASPKVEVKSQGEGKPLVFQAIVDVMPEVSISGWKEKVRSKKLKKEEIKISEKEITEVLGQIQQNFSEFKTVKRATAKGDRVEVDFRGKIIGSDIDDARLASKNHPVILGEGGFIPGFEENINGLKAGEEKTFKIKFPENYHAKEYAGKEAEFNVKLGKVEERILPEINDALAGKIGLKSLADLKKDIKTRLESQKKDNEKREGEEELIKTVAGTTKCEIPDSLVEEELANMLSNFSHQLAQSGLGLDQYLAQIKKTVDELKTEWQGQAEERIKIALAFGKIAEEEGIKISEEEIKDEYSKAHQGHNHKSELENVQEKGYIRNIIRNKKVIELMVKLNENSK